MRYPFNGTYRITTPFGVKDPAYAGYPDSRHSGTDYALPANTPLFAAMSGTVSVFDRSASIRTGRGKEVSIASGNLDAKTCHMNRIDVQNGQFVKEGQQIGLSGHTGYVVDAQGKVGTPGGAHLHFEILENGKYINPAIKLKEEDMPNSGDVDNIYLEFNGRKATEEEKRVYTNKSWSAGDGLYYGRALVEIRHLKRTITELQKALATAREATDPDMLKLAESIKAIAKK